MKKETICLNAEHNATLICYLWEGDAEYQTIGKRPGIIVIPGGGYEMCSEREADPIAVSYFQAGYQTFILRYAIQENKTWPNPLQDYEDAMSLIRANTEKWKVFPDKIAVVGFSAGGHLAGAAATMSQNRPNAAILGYAVLSKESSAMWNPSAPDIVSHVDADTCPCFLFHSRSDRLVPVTNTIAFIEALEKTGVTFETHIYSFGPHGFSTANQMMQGPQPDTMSARVQHWVADSIGFLQEIFGTFGNCEMSKPLVGGFAFPEKAGILSLDCSVAALMHDPRSAPIVMPVMQNLQTEAGGEQDAMGASMDAEVMLSSISLKQMLSVFSNFTHAQITDLEEQLAARNEVDV
ncbi:MAG: alpha/beta hydrolase [Lachnospiraceae bacterium]|nr:alpha/beta hydrolase [Lachnospiraceae bacterium]